MASLTPGGLLTLPQTSTDLSGSIYRLCIVSSGNATLPSGQGVQCLGIIEEPPVSSTSGLPVGIRCFGFSKIELGETMTAMAPFCAYDATGVGGVATTADLIMGLLIDGGSAGEVVRCVLTIGGIF